MNLDAKYPEIEVQLTGEDGNVFSIIVRISRALRSAEGKDIADEFTKEMMACGSYDEALQCAMRWVDVS